MSFVFNDNEAVEAYLKLDEKTFLVFNVPDTMYTTENEDEKSLFTLEYYSRRSAFSIHCCGVLCDIFYNIDKVSLTNDNHLVVETTSNTSFVLDKHRFLCCFMHQFTAHEKRYFTTENPNETKDKVLFEFASAVKPVLK